MPDLGIIKEVYPAANGNIYLYIQSGIMQTKSLNWMSLINHSLDFSETNGSRGIKILKAKDGEEPQKNEAL